MENTIEQEFQQIFENRQPANLYDPISYTLLQSGKRLRPKLVHMAVEMFGGSAEDAQKVAMAFEMLHNFTLIHDDIMDVAPIRRGKDTVYKKWNSNIAILSGDALAIMAFQQLLRLDCDNQLIMDIAKVFSQTSLEICEGQQYDLDFETQPEVSIDEYLTMITKKTSVMFAGCMKSGAILAGADEANQQHLYDMGINLGIAFQLADDVLDVYASSAAFGKTIGGDIRDNKKTYLYLMALQQANSEQKKILEDLFARPTTDFEQKYKIVRGIYDDLNIKAQTEAQVRKYVDLCLADLEKIQVADIKKADIKNLVIKLIDREK
jgi:geranylgeranyl diphosphate synthase type II